MDDLAGLYARTVAPIDRPVQLGVAGDKLVHVSFPESVEEGANEEHDLLDRIETYLRGDREDDFADVDVGLTVPTDQRSVLETLRKVSYGNAVSVEALARSTPGIDHEDEADRRTVVDALAANPIPIVLPDHRVDGVEGATPDVVRRRCRTVEGLSG